jgi:peptidoglycan-associated lipoprotein
MPDTAHAPREHQMKNTGFRTALTVGMVTLFLAACASKSKPGPETLPPAQSSTSSSGTSSSGTSESAPLDTLGSSQTGQSPTKGMGEPGSQEDLIASVGSDRVFFDYNSDTLDAGSQEKLRAQADWLNKYPNVKVNVEGHCDERGTREYNLALGDRRAEAVRSYLTSLGIAGGRINTVSYGKERPDAVGSDEESWARNRRSVTVVRSN